MHSDLELDGLMIHEKKPKPDLDSDLPLVERKDIAQKIA